MEVNDQIHAPTSSAPGNNPGIQFTGCRWVTETGQGVAEKGKSLLLHRISKPELVGS